MDYSLWEWITLCVILACCYGVWCYAKHLDRKPTLEDMIELLEEADSLGWIII